MKKYELLLVLPGTLDENEAQARSQEILNLIKEQDQEAELHVLGKSRLAYPIKQIRYGYFYTVVFSCEVDALKTLQEKIRLMRDLLRAMFTVFNTNLTATARIAYATDSLGITTMVQSEDKAAKEKKAEKVDLADIDKKLDEIIGGDVVPGV